MKMVPLVSLGFSRFSKLVQPSLLGHERCGQLSCLPGLAYSQGFVLSLDEYISRELGFCDWTGGHHHVLFKDT